MKHNRLTTLMWLLAFIPIIVALAAYRSLPAHIPIHWNISGTPDSFGARWVIVPLSAIGLLTTALSYLFRRIDPKTENYQRFSASYTAFFTAFNVLFLCMTSMTIFEALHPGSINVQMAILIAIGILFVIIGNMMPKFKFNYFIGIRTPWTLADETVWYRTHRMSGVLWVVGGLVFAACAFLPGPIAFAVCIADIVVLCIVPFCLSYYWYQRGNR